MYRKLLTSAAVYNSIELAMLFIICIVHVVDGEMYQWFMWLAFAAAALWTILASTHDAQEEAKNLVLHRDVFWTDFAAGALLMLLLSGVTVRYGIGYGIIFLVAAIQNLRYSALAYGWLEIKYDDPNST